MIKSLVKISQPINQILAALTYTLGAGIAHYLGKKVSGPGFGLGLLDVVALLGASALFREYFHLPLMPLAQGETPRQRERFRVTLLQVSYAALTLSCIAIVTLLVTHLVNFNVVILIFLTFLFITVYAIPPLRLSETGYGELILAVYLGTLLPAFGFLLQYGNFHRLLSFSTFPITLLALAYFLASNFPSFATDNKLGRHTLLTRLSWQRAVPIHHILILAAFLLFSTAPLLEFPWSLVWPVFLALPFAVIQIFWLQRIANGGRTIWKFLIAVASATFGLTVYLLTFTFWIR